MSARANALLPQPLVSSVSGSGTQPQLRLDRASKIFVMTKVVATSRPAGLQIISSGTNRLAAQLYNFKSKLKVVVKPSSDLLRYVLIFSSNLAVDIGVPGCPWLLQRVSTTKLSRQSLAASVHGQRLMRQTLVRLSKALVFISIAVPSCLFAMRRPPALLVCPSPHAALPLITHSQQRCVSVPSAMPEFELQLCQAFNACNAFTFRAKRLDPADCNRALAGQDPSEDKELNEWIKEKRGPDGFLLRTDGAERVVSEWSVHEGNCSYRFDIRLNSPGQVFVETWLTYEVCVLHQTLYIISYWK